MKLCLTLWGKCLIFLFFTLKQVSFKLTLKTIWDQYRSHKDEKHSPYSKSAIFGWDVLKWFEYIKEAPFKYQYLFG